MEFSQNHFRITRSGLIYEFLAQQTKMRFLIALILHKLFYLKNEVKKWSNSFSRLIQDNFFATCFKFLNWKSRRVANMKNQLLSQKLDNLLRGKNMAKESSWSSLPLMNKWLINTTNQPIPEEVHRVLQMGEKFGFRSWKLPVEKIITDAEYAISQTRVPDIKKDEVRQKVINHIRRVQETPAIWFNKNMKIEKMEEDIKRTRKFLNENRNLLIVKADGRQR